MIGSIIGAVAGPLVKGLFGIIVCGICNGSGRERISDITEIS